MRSCGISLLEKIIVGFLVLFEKRGSLVGSTYVELYGHDGWVPTGLPACRQAS